MSQKQAKNISALVLLKHFLYRGKVYLYINRYTYFYGFSLAGKAVFICSEIPFGQLLHCIKTKGGDSLDKKICGLILAAGKSQRMGSVKPVLKINGSSVIDLTTQMLKNAGITDIFTVLGCHRDVILEGYAAKDTVIIVDNPDYEQGMLSSVKAGVKAMVKKGSYDAFVMVPADCPAISPDTVKKVIDSFSGRTKLSSLIITEKADIPCCFPWNMPMKLSAMTLPRVSEPL